jgi:hypothetical protein
MKNCSYGAHAVTELAGATAMPLAAVPWSLTSLRENLIKIGARVVNHGRYIELI